MSQFNKTITLLDSGFAVYGDPIRAFESLSYSDAWEEHGALTLVVGADEFANIKDAAWLEVDGRVYENETQLADDEKATVKITGASLNVLFDRIVATADERLQGRLEERVRYLVNKYAVTGTQAVTGLTLGTDMGFARAMDATIRRGQTLSDFLYVQLNQRGFSFEIVCDCSTGALVFNVLCGLDRTQDQSVNAPVQISTRDALENASYKKSVKDYRNHAIVCDEDDTSPQTVEVDLSNGAPKRTMYVSGKSAGADTSEAPNGFVMVGTYSAGVGYIATSADGQTFTNRVTSGYAPFWAADFDNGEFTVCGNSGTILTSTDMVTWVPRTSGVSVALEGAKYSDGLRIVTGNSSAILSSYDGSTWAQEYSGLRKIIAPIAINGVFMTQAAAGLAYNLHYRSVGGVGNWVYTPIAAPVGYVSIFTNRMLAINEIALGIGVIGDGTSWFPFVSKSDDLGVSWIDTPITSLTGKRFLDAAYGNGIIVAVGQPNLIAWSDDYGATWHDVTPSGGTPDYITICFNQDTGVFHAYSATTKHHAYSDTTGKVWTLTTFTTTAALIDAVVYGTSSHSGDLYQIGLDALQSAQVVETLDGDINADLAPVYEVDYNIGDMIDAVDATREIVATKRVLSVEHLIDKDNDLAIIPKLGKEFLSLRQYIAKEIKKNGI